MASYTRDYIYCSSLLPVASLEAVLAERGSPFRHYADQVDSPEEALTKKRDLQRFHSWLRRLPPDLFQVALGLMRGDTQAMLARQLRISEAAISKRVGRILELGRRQLLDLRHSSLLQ